MFFVIIGKIIIVVRFFCRYVTAFQTYYGMFASVDRIRIIMIISIIFYIISDFSFVFRIGIFGVGAFISIV